MSEQTNPWVCPICRQPLIKAGSKTICPYQNLEWPAPIPFKGLEAIIYTNKEKEDALEQYKKAKKDQVKELNKSKRNS